MNQAKRLLLFSMAIWSLVAASPVQALAPKYSMMATESKIIKFDNPIQRALVANPELASVKVLNNKELLVSGQQAGKTELIIWYRDEPNNDVHVVLDIKPDQSRQDEISETVKQLLSQLDPDHTVSFEIKNIWIDAKSSVRRTLDQVGNQVDGDNALPAASHSDQTVLQSSQNAGALGVLPNAGNYMVLLTGSVPYEVRKKRIQSVVSALGLSVVNMIKVTGKNQIKLSVRIAEVTKGNPFKSGIALRDKRDRFGLFPPGNLGTAAIFNLNNDSPISGSQGGMAFPHPEAFQLGFNPMGNSIYGVLSILEGHNLARVLAKPELVVQSGESASFLVGGEIPIPTAQGNGAVTLTYKEFGVRLSFSPIINDEGQIQITVSPEVSNIDMTAGSTTGNVVVPGFRSRKATTTITLAPNQSFMIGGLIQDAIRSQVNKVPILGDIPILGALFRSSSYEHDKSELAILVTPSLVEPIDDASQLVLPGENLKRTSNADAFFLGKLVDVMPKGQSVLHDSMMNIGLESVE